MSFYVSLVDDSAYFGFVVSRFVIYGGKRLLRSRRRRRKATKNTPTATYARFVNVIVTDHVRFLFMWWRLLTRARRMKEEIHENDTL